MNEEKIENNTVLQPLIPFNETHSQTEIPSKYYLHDSDYGNILILPSDMDIFQKQWKEKDLIYIPVTRMHCYPYSNDSFYTEIYNKMNHLIAICF